jgi:tetratricopeptide (TPR) repeat protein
VLIFANLDHQLPRALELAQGELDIRQDVFSYDALAWALLKNGQLEAAQEAIAKALKMGTPEASFHYHAGMIAAALGKKADAVRELQQALTLNPQFDLRQAAIAQAKLKELTTTDPSGKETR